MSGTGSPRLSRSGAARHDATRSPTLSARNAVPRPSRARRRYSRGSMLRRRWTVRAVKWLLPVGALLLLSAFWHQARAAVVTRLPDTLRGHLPQLSPQPA